MVPLDLELTRLPQQCVFSLVQMVGKEEEEEEEEEEGLEGRRGRKMLALAHNRNNNRLAHMNHPPEEEQEGSKNVVDDDGDDGDGGDDDDDDDDDDDEGGGVTDGAPWELFLPFQYFPLWQLLYDREDDTCTPVQLHMESVGKVFGVEGGFNIDQVVEFCTRLRLAGFLIAP